MKTGCSIITVGLCPAWDITCRGRELDWGQHKVVNSCSNRPGGKALNVSLALAWMGERNTAAGLWGRDDYEQMLEAVRPLRRQVKVRMTTVAGRTRQNVTVVDTANNREMHLRVVSRLASKKALVKLRTDLEAIVNRNSICVFAGSMPQEGLQGDVVQIINCVRGRGARIVLDTSGKALRRIMAPGGIWLIKPNVEELSELLGESVKDTPVSLTKAGHGLLDKVDIVLISRGKKGAIVVTRQGAWRGRLCAARRKVLSTVSCGDYLLAGFLKGLEDKPDAGFALETAIKVATARAWGWTDEMKWPQVGRQIQVEVGKM